MTKFSSILIKTAVAATLLGSMSIASAGSGISGSAGATIDTGGGASAAGAGSSHNPGLALADTRGKKLRGPVWKVYKKFHGG